MFMTKKKKEQMEREQAEAVIREAEEAARLEEEREQTAFDRKLKVKKTYNSLKTQSAKLEKYNKDCINKYRQAMESEDTIHMNMYKTCIKITMSRKKMIDKMLGQYEFSMELQEINKIVNGFVEGITIISNELKDVVSTVDLSKAQRAFEEAVAKNENQMEALNAFLETASDSVMSFGGIEDSISDDEFESVVRKQIAEEKKVKAEQGSGTSDLWAKLDNLETN